MWGIVLSIVAGIIALIVGVMNVKYQLDKEREIDDRIKQLEDIIELYTEDKNLD